MTLLPCFNILNFFQYMIKMNLYRWFIMFMIGVGTAVIAVAIDISIEKMAEWKYSLIKKCILF